MTESNAPARPTLVEAQVILPPEVESVVGGPAPTPPERWHVEAPSLPFAVRGWGRGRPVLALHGVTSSAGSWWRLGPAIAAAGFTVVAPDMPGHGETPPPAPGRRSFTAIAGLLAELVAELGLPVDELAVIGHSWGAMVAAHLPAVGLRPARLVLMDPPTRDAAWGRERAAGARRAASRAEALAMALEAHPDWGVDDLGGKAEALLHLDPGTVHDVFAGDAWDGALGALSAPAAAGLETWVIRGEPAAGGYVPDDVLPAYAALIGAQRILTIASAEHSSAPLHPRATVAAILRALGAG